MQQYSKERLSEDTLLQLISYHRRKYNESANESERQRHYLAYMRAEDELVRRQNEVSNANEAE
jgi:hypothetical protein